MSAGRVWVQVPPRAPNSYCSRSPIEETRRRERRQCRCESCREYQFLPRDRCQGWCPAISCSGDFSTPEQTARSVAANALGLGPRDRRCNSCRADQFTKLSWSNYIRHPPSKRNHPGENPAGSTNPILPGSVKVARRPVKPRSVGASPTLAATLYRAQV